MAPVLSKPTMTKSPTNWIDLPLETRAECVKWMDFKTRMRLCSTSHTEKSLVESAPKFHFKNVIIEPENSCFPSVMCITRFRPKRQFVFVNGESGYINSLTKSYQLMIQVFKFATVYCMKFDLKLENDDEADQFISDICSSAPFEIEILEVVTANLRVAQFLVRNTNFKKLELGDPFELPTYMDGCADSFLLKDFADIPALCYRRNWLLKGKQTHDDVFMLIEKWIENDEKHASKMKCKVICDRFLEHLVEKFEDRIIEDFNNKRPANQFAYWILTENKSKVVVVVGSLDHHRIPHRHVYATVLLGILQT